MCIEYYLLCKKKYETLINEISNLIFETEFFLNELEELPDCIQENELTLVNDITYYKSKLKHYIELKNICINKIRVLCQHEFETDYIDITPERSERITYCKICEYTISNSK